MVYILIGYELHSFPLFFWKSVFAMSSFCIKTY